jgi:RNA polymerase sigma-70 factor, ECF subfamily
MPRGTPRPVPGPDEQQPEGESPEAVDLRELVVTHRAEIFRYARSLTYCDADAEDLAQAALVRALERDVVLREPTKAKHYLMRIVRNLAIDAARARARVVVEPHADVPELGVEATAEDLVLGAADLELPADVLEDLPEWHRAVLQMRYVEELDYADVAERLQVTEHAARQRVYRAMQALRAVARRRRFRPS